jgi:hypothetical protein
MARHDWTQEHLFGAYIMKTMEILSLSEEQNNSEEADKIREDMENLWNDMEPETVTKLRPVLGQLGAFSIVQDTVLHYTTLFHK